MPNDRSPARTAWLVLPLLAMASVQLWALASGASSRALPTFLSDNEPMWLVAQAWALAAVLVLAWRVWLVAGYRPVPSVDDARLPAVTVIVPAYNEGRQVYETLRSLADSDYPREKLRIIAVDDGSVDDTWQWIERGRESFPRLVTSVRCRVNRGKRHALYEGFERATGEVIVTVDSDSEVLADTLRCMVSPFVVDSRVGAVAGNVRVLNDRGAFGRMLDVSFNYAFEFMRASESRVDTVSCCPGALSAYRRSLIDAFKDEWLEQTFLGSPANIGEDRAMTNLVLRHGHLVRFQSNAMVFTEVPSRLPQLSRMLLRWGRSNVRESLVLGRFVFTRFRRSSAWGARVNWTWATARLLLGAVLFLPSLALLTLRPELLLVAAPAIAASALLPAAVFASSRGNWHALWALPYAFLSAVCLSWIGPWALVTPHRSGWLTRAKPSTASLPAHVAPLSEPAEARLAVDA